MEGNATSDPTPVLPVVGREHPDPLNEADALLATLATERDPRPLREHVEVLEVVHQALVDALVRTES